MEKKVSTSKNSKEQEQEMLIKALRPDPVEAIRMEDLIETFLNDAQHSLGILPESDFNRALQQFVEKDDKNAISEYGNIFKRYSFLIKITSSNN